MEQRQRTALAFGVVLILIGVWFRVAQLVPALRQQGFHWPLIVIAVGFFLFVLGLLTRSPSLSIPACVVAGVGGLLYWQFLTGRWDSWSYAWALIPGFVGLGMLLTGLLGERRREMYRGGVSLLVISLILFVIFGAFLGGFFGLGDYWPVLLILLGLFLLIRPLFWRR